MPTPAHARIPNFEEFANPPIREALIDIRVRQSRKVEFAELQEIHGLISDSYPEARERRQIEATMDMAEEDDRKPVRSSSRLQGLQCVSKDGVQVVQFRFNGFALSRLRPYENWQQLRDEAHELWELYRQELDPALVTRLAVRYINSVAVPRGRFNLDEYLIQPPEVPEGVPQMLEHLYLRYAVRSDDPLATALVQLAVPHSVNDQSTSILFDIDVFRELTLPRPFKGAWEILDSFRDLKNHIFFRSFTENAMELFR